MQAARRGVATTIVNGLRGPAVRPAAFRIGGNQRIQLQLSREPARLFSLLVERRAGVRVAQAPQLQLRSEFSTLGRWGNKDTKPLVEEEEKKVDEEAKTEEKPENEENKADEDGDKKKEEEKKQEEPSPPPPPHGDKSPLAVFMETLQTEFKKSQEWQESTKQLASTANQFTESPAVQKAREGYSKTAEVAGKVGGKTAETLGKTASAVGKGVEWTWNTPVVKAGRTAVKKTGEGVAQVTKPVRDTKVYKDVTSNIKEVVDDGAGSRYGGFLEREERKKLRELREMKNPQKIEKFEEDRKYAPPHPTPPWNNS